MGFSQAAKGVAEFFNLSNVSKAFSSLGGGAADDLARTVDRTHKAQSLIGKAVDTMDDTNKALWGEIDKNLRKSGMSSADMMKGMESAVSELESKGAFKKALDDETFAKALEEFKSKQGKTPLEYFGREAQGNLTVRQKLTGAVLDPEYGKTRLKAAAGGAAATAIGVRYLSGGNLTTNSRGEHDIAGIPIF